MNPATIKLLVKAAALLAVFGAGFGVRAYIADKDALEIQNTALSEKLELAQGYADRVDERDTRNQALNDKLHNLDAQHTRDLHEELAENDRLRTDLAAARSMRFQGAICPAGSTGTEAGRAGGMGDGAGLELSAEARQDVLDLRNDLIWDRAKINYLQSYIRRLGLWPPSEEQTEE